ncbi:MAG: DUF6600 domain-containing protein [Limisphaerales bacterium]
MKPIVLPVSVLLLFLGCSLQGDPETPPSAASITNAVPTTNSVQAAASPMPVSEFPEDLPEPAREVVRLAHARVGDSTIQQFIANLTEPFHLKADQVVYLRDVGLSETVLEALLSREQLLAASAPPPSQDKPSEKPTPAAPPAPEPQAPTLYPGGAQPVPPPQVGPAVAASAPEPTTQINNYNVFYSSLAPYGSWVTVPTYGYVWQPTCAVATPGWRPYWNNGCWAWSDAGWYWNSYYSWGWAPFHYGNWVQTPSCGWCWVPGSTWAPSWVTFRYGGGYCGWAPLPPGCGFSTGVGLTWSGSGISVGFSFGFGATDYCWTPAASFTAANCWTYGVPRSQVNEVYQNSTVINNYVTGNNNTIVNGGIAPTTITQHTRSEIRKVALTDVASPSQAGRSVGPRSSPDQGRLAVYRPKLGQDLANKGLVTVSRDPSRPGSMSTTIHGGGSSSLPRRPGSAATAGSAPTAPGMNLTPSPIQLLNNRPNTTTPIRAGNASSGAATARPTSSPAAPATTIRTPGGNKPAPTVAPNNTIARAIPARPAVQYPGQSTMVQAGQPSSSTTTWPGASAGIRVQPRANIAPVTSPGITAPSTLPVRSAPYTVPPTTSGGSRSFVPSRPTTAPAQNPSQNFSGGTTPRTYVPPTVRPMQETVTKRSPTFTPSMPVGRGNGPMMQNGGAVGRPSLARPNSL